MEHLLTGHELALAAPHSLHPGHDDFLRRTVPACKMAGLPLNCPVSLISLAGAP